MLAEGLAEQGHQVCVLIPASEKTSPISYVNVRTVSLGENSFPSFTGHPLSSTMYSDLNHAALTKIEKAWTDAFVKLKEEWSPDITHVQHIWNVARAAICAGLNPIITCHGSELHFIRKHRQIADICLPPADRIKHIIFISDHVRKKAQEAFAGPFRGHLISNPCNTLLFCPGSRRIAVKGNPHIGFVGRLVKYKNCGLFLHCVAMLRADKPALVASVVGDGPERLQLEDLAKELGIRPYVHFWGHLPQGELPSLYRSFDVLIVPSDNEPFGLVALESVACGTPAIVAANGGLAEVISPPFITGFQPNDLKDLVLKVKLSLDQIGSMSKPKFYEFVNNNYSIAQYIVKINTIYQDN
jgi:glycosyltransferase involved in cell wall biosynthesis